MKLRHGRKPVIKIAFKKLCSPLFFGVCLIAGCWLGSAYVLVVHSDSGDESHSTVFRLSLCDLTLAIVHSDSGAESHSTGCSTPTLVENKPDAPSDNSDPDVDWELVEVLSEMDIRNPSPEHEAFLRAYLTTPQE